MKRLAFALLAVLLGAALATPLLAQSAGVAPVRIAQSDKPRNLFDLLFGNSPARTPPKDVPSARKTTKPSPSAVTLPPAKPAVEKAETATRVAVFGDSMAIDLSKALARAYTEDPNLVVIGQGVGSSGFVRDDFFDWNKAIGEAIAKNSFDIAVVFMGINDRQPITKDGQELAPLTEEWKSAYADRLNRFLNQLRAANKPVIWAGLPPMRAKSYSAAIAQISSVQKLAAFSGGADFVDIYDRFTDEAGGFSSYGPDLNGRNVLMRKSNGIHFTTAGADKLAFYVGQALKRIYRGGTLSLEISDPLAGTDAAAMMRLPFQGLGQARRVELAGAILPLTETIPAAQALVETGASTGSEGDFDLRTMVTAPVGRADAFGVGVDPAAEGAEPTGGGGF